jgi:predicted NBD/HSP70 family sugar kinase
MIDKNIRRNARGSDSHPTQLADCVMRLIWSEKQISRAEIARQAKLSRSTVSDIVGGLLKKELVAEVGSGPSSGGRRPIVLEFQYDNRVVLGVEMGASHVSVVLTNLGGRVLAWEEKAHPVRTDPIGTRRLIRELCDRVLEQRGLGTCGLVGMGIAVPCPLDPEDPDKLSPVVLPAWEAHAGFDAFAHHFGVPVMVDNDANLGALAEAWWGSAAGLEDLMYLKVGMGIGSGHIIHGEIYRGSTGYAGEIGHVSIDPQGPPCVCGLRGCLVTFAGVPALLDRALALRKEFPESPLAADDLDIDIETIENAAMQGDPMALRVVEGAAEALGVALAGVINVLNPAMVVVGGGLARVGDLLLRPLQEMAQERTLMHSLAASRIRVSEMGAQCIAIGAATLVLKAALEDSRLIPAAAKVPEATA